MNTLFPMALGKVTVSRTGATFSERLTREEWEELRGPIREAGTAIQWLRGDWLNYGAGKWGEKYAEGVAGTEHEYQTLANCAWVCRAVQFSRRRENLSWSHHAEVAGLPAREQEVWLARCEGERWPVAKLRAALRAEREPAEVPRNGGQRSARPTEFRFEAAPETGISMPANAVSPQGSMPEWGKKLEEELRAAVLCFRKGRRTEFRAYLMQLAEDCVKLAEEL